MKNFLFILGTGLFLIVKCYGLEWNDHWINAVQYCSTKNFEAAETEFSLAISILENSNDKTHPHMWIELAYMLCRIAILKHFPT